jgi:hypothetical protein
MKASEDTWLARVARLIAERDHIELHIDLDTDLPLGLMVHRGERDAMLSRVMRRSGATILRRGRQCRFVAHERSEACALVHEIHQNLLMLTHKPISQYHVEKLLAITPAERLRWSKDGRLKRSGTANITRGAKITLYTYPPQIIEQLMRTPAIIAAWRQSDT